MPTSFVDKLNFPLILVIGTAVTGLIWLIDAVFFAPKRKAAVRSDAAQVPLITEYAQSFFPVLLIVLVLRSFLFEPFRIPSASMVPTLLIGDFILVNKYSYGVRLPVTHTKIFDTGAPERGDVAVFRFPRNPKLDYIKRVVGLPGDTITFQGAILTVNGVPVKVSGADPYAYVDVGDRTVSGERIQATLGDVTHDILVSYQGSSQAQTVEVPEGHYFMVGDNRNHSNDSRFWGFVPEANLVGKATYIWMHWRSGVQWNRLGDKIQ